MNSKREAMKKIFDHVIPPKSGLAVEVKQGQHIRIIDLKGKQVVDTVFFNLDNLREKSSPSYSRSRYFSKLGQKYVPHDHLEEGDWIMSTICRPMMTIVKETSELKGLHDTHHRLCNKFVYKVFAGIDRDGCHEIISKVIAPYALLPEDVPDPVSFFMNYPYDCEKHHFTILEPKTKPGDCVELRAEMNCLVAMSNCPDDITSPCNAYKCTPIKVEIYEDEMYQPKPILSPDEWLEEELHRRNKRVSCPRHGKDLHCH